MNEDIKFELNAIFAKYWPTEPKSGSDLQAEMLQYVTGKIEAERAACLAIVEDWLGIDECIGTAIRARSNPKSESTTA